MGSFSERLKRIRENRSAKTNQLLKGSPSPKTDSRLLRGSPSPKTTFPLTGNTATERLSSTKQTNGSDLLVSSSPLTSFPTSPALSTQSTSSSLSYGGSTPPISTITQLTNLETFTEAMTSKNIQPDTLTDLQTQSTAVVASSVVITDASESSEQDKPQVGARKALHIEVSESSLNNETIAEGTEPSKGMQQKDNDSLSHENTPPQLEKESLVLDIPVQDDDDEVPTAPPPPIPDLPPPPDDLPLEVDPEEPVNSSTQSDPPVVDEPARPAAVTTKSSFRTIKKKEEWTRKSAELDSLMMDPLPLLISTKPSRNRPPDPLPEVNETPDPSQTINEYPLKTEGEAELLTNNDVLHDSSESLPSLPETPPPELPDGPPPDLPLSFSLNGMEFESDALEEKVISETLLIPPEDNIVEESEVIASSLPTLEDASVPSTDEIVAELPESKPESQPQSSPESTPPLEKEQPTAIHSETVQLRRPRRAANGTTLQDVNLQRRSAFDALVAVEPTAEEKNEPRLSAEQRRSLALEASRRSDADTSPFLERWNISVPRSKPDSKEEKDESVSKYLEEPKEFMEALESPENKEVMVDHSSSTEQTKRDKDLKGLRPKSIAGIDDLQASLKRVSEDESRWSLPPDSEIFQSVNVIPDPAPKLSGEMKAKWKKFHLLTADGNPSLSASTGQLFSRGRDTSSNGDSKAGKSSSWRTLHSSSESLPHFVGLRKKSPSSRQMQPLAVSPLAASVSVASTSSKEGSVSQLNKEQSASTEVQQESPQQISKSSEVDQESPQQISYAQKLRVESRASARKRRSLVLSEDDQTPTPVENASEDSLLVKVPLRKKVQNLQLASVMAERALDSPRPASLVLDRDILKVNIQIMCSNSLSTNMLWC